jgi:hypothetical protein
MERASDMDVVQTTVETMVGIMDKWDGTMVQFRCDEKGFVAICAFGLPTQTSAFPTTQGVQASLAAVETFASMGIKIHIGVTTDQLLCCSVGSSRRREVRVPLAPHLDSYQS